MASTCSTSGSAVSRRSKYCYSAAAAREAIALPTTEAEVRVGLYDYETGERLEIGESDYVRLALSMVVD